MVRQAEFVWFSFDGRVSRSSFLRKVWLIYVVQFLISLSLYFVHEAGFDKNCEVMTFVLLLGVIFVCDVCIWPLMVRRLHDLNLSGWWLMLSILVCGSPTLAKSIWIVKLLLLSCVKGDRRPNDYGVIEGRCGVPQRKS